MKAYLTKYVPLVLIVILLAACSANNTISQNNNVEIQTQSPTTLKSERISETTEKVIIDPILEQMKKMTLHQKICQLFIVIPDSLIEQMPVTQINKEFNEVYQKYPVGGFILFDDNILTKSQLISLVDDLKALSRESLFIGIDQEGGSVARLNKIKDFPILNAMYNYKDKDKLIAYKNANNMAIHMKSLGFNLNFAPVADVWSNKNNTVIGRRAYSDDYQQASEFVGAAVEGFRDANLLCTLKHFPGHGDTLEDSHSEIAYVKKTREELSKNELLPFKMGLKSGANMVMVGHLLVKDIDDQLPATFSKKVVNDYLRSELNYDGIVITDSMSMGAVVNQYNAGEAAVMAINAGVDIILMPYDIKEAVTVLEQAVEQGDISEARINQSIRRILRLKNTPDN